MDYHYNMLSNRLNASEEYISHRGDHDEAHRVATCRGSPSHFLAKGCPKWSNDKKIYRNISEDSKSSARHKNRKNQERDDSLKRRTGSEMQEIYQELLDLKAKYRTLKDSYNLLVKDKVETNKSVKSSKEEIGQLTVENMEMKRQNEDIKRQNQEIKTQNEAYKNQMLFLQQELQRIKKESVKMLEVEGYRMKKLEENLREKDKIIASRNQSSLSFFHDDVALTEARDYNNRGGKVVSLSYRDRGSNINTEIVEQKLVYRKEEDTIECTIENITHRDRERRSISSQSSVSSIDIHLAYKTKEFEAFKKKTPLETLNVCKSPDQKKKRSITNGKGTTGKKKPLKSLPAKPKKTTNQTFR